jgi:uncharacterized protein YjbJ (UPF0337 family)
MNDDQAKGNFDQMKGDLKEGWGKLTGNEKTEAEGKMDKLGGKVREGLGDIKGAIDKGTRRDEEVVEERREEI